MIEARERKNVVEGRGVGKKTDVRTSCVDSVFSGGQQRGV
jgi:hypothetical protein